jgi:hypothetical protein
MTRDQALAANKLIDEEVERLEPVWQAAIEARDRSQWAVEAIQKIRVEARQRQIANLKSVKE